jgi:ATP-binding cassette subfamily F protein 3
MLALTDIGKSFGRRTLFSGVSINIGARDRLALLGANGSGKSTLLEIIAGEASPDEGCITRRRDLTVGYLRQEIRAASSRPLLQEVTSAPGQLVVLAHRLQVIQDELSQGVTEEEQYCADWGLKSLISRGPCRTSAAGG